MIFVREFLKCPLQVASIIPSSRVLERCIVDMADVGSARTIVELGPGTGGTTRAILRAMATDARLLSIEINPRLLSVVGAVRDERLILQLGDARDLPEMLSAHGLGAPELVISGIPFSTMDRAAGSGIIEKIVSTLAPGGRFVTYQVSKRVISQSRPLLGHRTIRARFVLLNAPPLRVFRWDKPVACSKPVYR